MYGCQTIQLSMTTMMEESTPLWTLRCFKYPSIVRVTTAISQRYESETGRFYLYPLQKALGMMWKQGCFTIMFFLTFFLFLVSFGITNHDRHSTTKHNKKIQHNTTQHDNHHIILVRGWFFATHARGLISEFVPGGTPAFE